MARRAHGAANAAAGTVRAAPGSLRVYTLDLGCIFTCAYTSTLPLFLGARARSHDRQQLVVELVYAGRGWHAGFNRAASTEVEQATIVPRIRSGIAARRGRPARRDLRGPTDEHEPVA